MAKAAQIFFFLDIFELNYYHIKYNFTTATICSPFHLITLNEETTSIPEIMRDYKNFTSKEIG